jgi:hypothetical protein
MRRYSPYSFLTSALDGDEWSASSLGRALVPEKGHRYPLYRRLGGPQSLFGHRATGKILSPLPGIEPRSPGRPARTRNYTDCATRLTVWICSTRYFLIRLVILSLTVSCQNGSVYSIFKLTLLTHPRKCRHIRFSWISTQTVLTSDQNVTVFGKSIEYRVGTS